jgi:fatty acid synthase subunit beta
MVLPGVELSVKINHVGMRKARRLRRSRQAMKVLEGSAEVAQPTTVYVFSGQGLQEAGIGMGLYHSSPAARAV